MGRVECKQCGAMLTATPVTVISQWNNRATEAEIRAKAIDEFAHELKETFNQECPLNYKSTRPYFTLENVRKLVDEIAEQLKEEDEG